MFPNGFFGNVLSKYSDSSADIFTNNTTSAVAITVSEFCLCVGAALVIGFLISLIYIATHRKEGYSQSYVMTMIMLPTIVSLILLLVNSTAGALTLAGAFTLVRFRSVAGDPKDIAYIFFAMAAGVACGIGFVGFGILFFVILGIIMFVLSEINFGASKSKHMTLKITIPENLDYQGVFDPVLSKYTNFHKLRRVKTTNFGTLFELIYAVEISEDIDQKKFIDELRALNGNMTINLVFFKYDDKIYES
ncbi:MAG: DUF4956 domain-containing protein [Ruminococcus sp.]|nr:DUF4956 domain-containing protein [Ruminococcus sp.]MBP8594331.1 DUF4956 domain-containing protein [Ruminococcus sp.]MBQ8124191.1 DUF4956 domain-containing protein [Ruminococcus sp.]HBB19464.1 DUF4956 domain-containing protein [Ruminococcus sp.]HOO07725.1 DUF4956 domain-containing protein [Ruminococcus sp.]